MSDNEEEEEYDDIEQMQHYGACKIQSVVRMMIVRFPIVRSINARYEKIYDPRKKKHYYYDKELDRSAWKKPRLLLHRDLDTVSPTYSDEVAITMVQTRVRMILAKLKVRLAYQSTVQTLVDDDSSSSYYYNPNSGATMWDLPEFMNGRLDYAKKAHVRRASVFKQKNRVSISTKSQILNPAEQNDNEDIDENKKYEDEDELTKGGSESLEDSQVSLDPEDDNDKADDSTANGDDDDDDDEDKTNEEEEDASDEDDYSSDDSEAERARKKLRRKYPRSKSQAIVDNAVDNLHETTELDLAAVGAGRITSRIYDLVELRKLNISNNQLTRISSNIQYLANLVHLDIHNNLIRTLPPELEELKSVTYLDASQNKLKNYTGRVYKMTSLTELNISDNPLKAIPVEVGNLELLQELGQWEVGISQLAQLQRLLVGRCLLTEWPPQIEALERLEYLDLSHNQLKEVPVVVTESKQLKTLLLGGNQIAKLPVEFFDMKGLEILDLSHNQLTSFPIHRDPDTLAMDGLKDLNISNNLFEELDDHLGAFYALEKFDASSNKLKRLKGESMNKWTSLLTLILSNNQLEELPAGLGGCVRLTDIYVQHNMLSKVPESMIRTTKLITIDLSYNQITDPGGKVFAMLNDLRTLKLQHNEIGVLPPLMYSLRHVAYIDMSYNKIPDIAEGLGQLQSLTYLNLSYNQITSIPDSISNLVALSTLELKSNKLRTIPSTISKLYRKLRRVTISHNELSESPNLLKELSFLISCNLSWNTRIQSKFIDWAAVGRDVKARKTFLPLPVLQRKVERAVARLDIVLNAAKAPRTFYKGEAIQDSTAFVEAESLGQQSSLRPAFPSSVSLKSEDESSDGDSLSAAPSLASSRKLPAGKGRKKRALQRTKELRKLQRVFRWHQDVQDHLHEFARRDPDRPVLTAASASSKAKMDKTQAAGAQQNGAIGGGGAAAGKKGIKAVLKRVQSKRLDKEEYSQVVEPTMDSVTAIREHELHAYMFSLFQQLDKERGTGTGSSLEELIQHLPAVKFDAEKVMFGSSIDAVRFPHLATIHIGGGISGKGSLSSEEEELSRAEVIESVDISPEIQDNIEEFQSILNEIDSLIMLQELRHFMEVYDAKSKEINEQMKEQEAFDNVASHIKQRMGHLSGVAKRTLAEKAQARRETIAMQQFKGLPAANDGNHDQITAAVTDPSKSAGTAKNQASASSKVATSTEHAESTPESRSIKTFRNIDKLARNVNSDVEWEREKKRRREHAAKLRSDILTRIDGITRSSLQMDFTRLPHLAHSVRAIESLAPTDRSEECELLLSLLVVSCINLTRALLHRADGLRDAIRELEVRSQTSISSMDIAQRKGDDFEDCMNDIYEELSAKIQAKENDTGGGGSIFGKNKKGAGMSELLLVGGEELEEDGEELGDIATVAPADKKMKGKATKGAPNHDDDDDDGKVVEPEVEKPLVPELPDIPLSTLLPPIDPDRELIDPVQKGPAVDAAHFLAAHRTLTLRWACFVLDVAASVSRRRGMDPKYPNFRAHHTNTVHIQQEWVASSAPVVTILRGRLYQGLQLYSQSLEEYGGYLKFSSSRKQHTRYYYIEMIKLHLAQGNFVFARNTVHDTIRRFYSQFFPQHDLHDPTAMPDTFELLRVDRELALLSALVDENVLQLEKQRVFSSPHNKLNSVQENGLLTMPSRVAPEVEHGMTLWRANKLRATRESELSEQSSRAALEEARADVRRRIDEARSKAESYLHIF